MAALALTMGLSAALLLGPSAAPTRHSDVVMQFKAPISTDTAVADQQARSASAGLTPKEYEEMMKIEDLHERFDWILKRCLPHVIKDLKVPAGASDSTGRLLLNSVHANMDAVWQPARNFQLPRG